LQIPAGIIRELKKKESDTFTNRMLLNYDYSEGGSESEIFANFFYFGV
jgi:hypothetical protein